MLKTKRKKFIRGTKKLKKITFGPSNPLKDLTLVRSGSTKKFLYFSYLILKYPQMGLKKKPRIEKFSINRPNFEIRTTVFCYHKYNIERKNQILGVYFFFSNWAWKFLLRHFFLRESLLFCHLSKNHPGFESENFSYYSLLNPKSKKVI